MLLLQLMLIGNRLAYIDLIPKIYQQLIVNRGCHIHIVRTQQDTLYFSVIGFLAFDIRTDMKGKEGNLILIDIHMKALHQLHSDKNGDIINCRTAGLNSIHHGILCVGIIADTKQKIF